MSQVTGFMKTGNGRANATILFRGMNVLFLSDFHQFPPVANSHASLYASPSVSSKETTTWVVGCNIYAQFKTVVTLTEQMRVTDNIWRQILEHSRMGDCTKKDLVTPHNIMRQKWNAATLQWYCKKSWNVLYICQVEDAVEKERWQLTMEEMTIVASLDPEDMILQTSHKDRSQDWNKGHGNYKYFNGSRSCKWYAWNHHRYNSGP